jgi:hypothetical protein
VRAWALGAPVRYVRCVGGPAGREGLLAGLRDGAVLMLYIDRDAAVPLFTHDAPVRCARRAARAPPALDVCARAPSWRPLAPPAQRPRHRTSKPLPTCCRALSCTQPAALARFGLDTIRRGRARRRRCLDLSAGRGRVAVVDDARALSVYCLATRARLWGAPGAASAAWNTECDDMLAWSGGGRLLTRTADFPPHAQPLQVLPRRAAACAFAAP